MLVIRFSRVGRKNSPHFRIVVQESSVAPTGRHVAIVGSYNPKSKDATLKTEEIKDWIAKGAQASDSVYNLLIKEGVIDGPKRVVKIRKKPVEESEKEDDKDKKGEEKEKENEKVESEENKEEVKEEKEEVESTEKAEEDNGEEKEEKKEEK